MNEGCSAIPKIKINFKSKNPKRRQFNPLTAIVQYIVDYTVLACSHNSASHAG